MNYPNEVERLRARVAELEEQLTTAAPPAPPPEAGARRSRWWAVSSGILIALACVLAPLSVTAVWASTQLSDTDQYVETVAPLAEDPAVQRAVADKVTRVVFESIDIEGLTVEALDTLAQQGDLPPRVAAALPALAVPITNGIESFTRTQVDNILATPEFAAAWEQVNRIAHEQVVNLLEGNQGGGVSAQGDTITLNIGPIIEQVKQRLVDQGFTLAANVPAVDQSFVLVQSEAITSGQGVYSLLNTLGSWLPVIVVALLAAGIFLAGDRRRALLRGALGITAAMVVLGVALAIARVLYLDAVPADVLPSAAAGSTFDTLVRFLRTGLRAAAVLGLVVALAAFLTGPSAAAVRTRTSLEGGIGSLRGSAESAGWQSGRAGTWTYAHRRQLRIGAAVAGGIVLMFWTRPTTMVVVVTALVVLLVLAVIEFLGRPPARPVAGAPAASEVPLVPRQVRRPVPESAGETIPTDQSESSEPASPEAKL